MSRKQKTNLLPRENINQASTRVERRRQRREERLADLCRLAAFLLTEMQALQPQVPLEDEGIRLVEEFHLAVREGTPFDGGALPAMEVLDCVAWERSSDPDVPRASVEFLSLMTWIAAGTYGDDFLDHLGHANDPKAEGEDNDLDRILDMIVRVAPRLLVLIRIEDRDGCERISLTWEGRRRFGQALSLDVKKCKPDRFTPHGRYWEE